MPSNRSQLRLPRRNGAAEFIVDALSTAPFTNANVILLGDFNDYFERDGHPLHDHGLGPLIEDGFAVDLATHAIADPYDRWTHHYNGDDTYGALDHIFLSPALALRNPRPHVRIVRGGTPFRARRYEGARFPGVGWSEPKASDHCPLAATLQFEGRPLAP